MTEIVAGGVTGRSVLPTTTADDTAADDTTDDEGEDEMTDTTTHPADERGADPASFEDFYQHSPPWETGEPQPAVVDLVEQGRFSGRVLDVGCGTGENALYLASRGYAVLGVDGAPTPVARARHKADQRGLPAEFAVADAFDLAALGRTFDTVLDSAFLHIPGNTAASRRAYTDQLARVLRTGGWVHLLEISEQEAEHPSITSTEITDAFDDRWEPPQVQQSTYRVTTGDVPAWVVSLQRR